MGTRNNQITPPPPNDRNTLQWLRRIEITQRTQKAYECQENSLVGQKSSRKLSIESGIIKKTSQWVKKSKIIRISHYFWKTPQASFSPRSWACYYYHHKGAPCFVQISFENWTCKHKSSEQLIIRNEDSGTWVHILLGTKCVHLDSGISHLE